MKGDRKMLLKEIQEIAKKNELEAVLWEKYGQKKIYLNSYTGAGYRRDEGVLDILADGTIEINKRGNYTKNAKKVWLEIPSGAKLEVE